MNRISKNYLQLFLTFVTLVFISSSSWSSTSVPLPAPDLRQSPFAHLAAWCFIFLTEIVFQVPNMFFLVIYDSLYCRFPIYTAVFSPVPRVAVLGGGSTVVEVLWRSVVSCKHHSALDHLVMVALMRTVHKHCTGHVIFWGIRYGVTSSAAKKTFFKTLFKGKKICGQESERG